MLNFLFFFLTFNPLCTELIVCISVSLSVWMITRPPLTTFTSLRMTSLHFIICPWWNKINTLCALEESLPRLLLLPQGLGKPLKSLKSLLVINRLLLASNKALPVWQWQPKITQKQAKLSVNSVWKFQISTADYFGVITAERRSL